jgi:cold shock CspA family protein
MEKPVEIDFQGFAPSEAQTTLLNQKIAQLEDKFGRIAAGRIAVRAPSARHQTGGIYDISIRLRLPKGKEVDISRTPQDDERYADFHFALNDAFKRAERQLLKHVDHIAGDVKSHESPPLGKVARLFEDHGFIATDDGLEIYFHSNSVVDGGFERLSVGTRVSFSDVAGEKGPQASTVHPIVKHGMK